MRKSKQIANPALLFWATLTCFVILLVLLAVFFQKYNSTQQSLEIEQAKNAHTCDIVADLEYQKNELNRKLYKTLVYETVPEIRDRLSEAWFCS